MKCQNCGVNEANVRYTQIINGVKKEMALCEECSKNLGISDFDFNMPINFSNFLGDLFEDTENLLPDYIRNEELKCDGCGMTYQEFSKVGKFGCAKCPEAFKSKLNRILQNVHGTTKHVGKEYKTIDKPKVKETISNEEIEKQNKLKDLKRKQEKAIKEENYEEAAILRDKIKELEN